MRRRGLFLLSATVLLLGPPVFAETPTVIGEHVVERYETQHPYVSSGGTEPMLTWVDRIDFPGATYIAVHFERMDLAAGDSVVVRSPDGQQQ